MLHIVARTPPTATSRNYHALLQLFDATKKQLYSPDGLAFQPFLDPDLLGFHKVEDRKVIRKANLATLICSVFGSVDVGFYHLNEAFLATLAPDGTRLLKDIAKLFLDLKTQVLLPPDPYNGQLIIGLYFGDAAADKGSACNPE